MYSEIKKIYEFFKEKFHFFNNSTMILVYL